MRLRTSAVAAALAVAACGEASDARLRREVAPECGAAADAFVADLDAGRVEAALARTTRGFQGAAPAGAIRVVLDAQRRALGAPKSRAVRGVESVTAEGEPPRVREAVVVCDLAFERGAASSRTRLVRDPVRGGWLVDGHDVRNDYFTWTYRK